MNVVHTNVVLTGGSGNSKWSQSDPKWTSNLEPRASLGGSWGLLGALVALLWRCWSLLARLACCLRLYHAIPVGLEAILLLLDHVFSVFGWIFDALATLRIELSPAWELNFHVFAFWSVATFRKQDLLAYFS